MRRLLILALACMVLISCGTFRKVFKSKEYSKVKMRSEVKRDSNITRVDNSITTITETVDTIIKVPGAIITQDIILNMDSLVNGMTAIKNELIDVKLHLNPSTGVLSITADIKPKLARVKLNKFTTKANDITENKQGSEATLNTNKETSKSNKVEKEPFKMGIWLVAIVVGILAVFFLFRGR